MIWLYCYLALSLALAVYVAVRMDHDEPLGMQIALVAGVFAAWPVILPIEAVQSWRDWRWRREVRRMNEEKAREATS